jgi:hypothetical protein
MKTGGSTKTGFGFKVDTGGFDPFAPPGPSGPAAPPPGAPPGAPPFAPGPMAPPPGSFGPGQYPAGPQPRQGSSAWKYVLIGCGGLILLAGLVAVGTCVYGIKKAPELMTKGMGAAKIQYMKELTGDHTDKQKERFSSLYDAVYGDELKRLGMMKWAQSYQQEMEELGQIAGDGQITVDESGKWCDDAYKSLEDNGYWKDEK